MKITIRDNEIELKQSIRALMMYENITGETFQPTNMTQMVTFMYCIVVASSGDYSLGLDEFLDELDKDPSIMETFNVWFSSSTSNQNSIKKN